MQSAATGRRSSPPATAQAVRFSIDRAIFRWLHCARYAISADSYFLIDFLRSVDEGIVNIYFGPKPPAGQASNWLYTKPGEKWFPWFRVYGPEKAIFDKSWKLPDIEMIG